MRKGGAGLGKGERVWGMDIDGAGVDEGAGM
jgi:hypothetical protein